MLLACVEPSCFGDWTSVALTVRRVGGDAPLVFWHSDRAGQLSRPPWEHLPSHSRHAAQRFTAVSSSPTRRPSGDLAQHPVVATADFGATMRAYRRVGNSCWIPSPGVVAGVSGVARMTSCGGCRPAMATWRDIHAHVREEYQASGMDESCRLSRPCHSVPVFSPSWSSRFAHHFERCEPVCGFKSTGERGTTAGAAPSQQRNATLEAIAAEHPPRSEHRAHRFLACQIPHDAGAGAGQRRVGSGHGKQHQARWVCIPVRPLASVAACWAGHD